MGALYKLSRDCAGGFDLAHRSGKRGNGGIQTTVSSAIRLDRDGGIIQSGVGSIEGLKGRVQQGRYQIPYAFLVRKNTK